MIGILDVAIAMLGFIAGAGVASKAYSNKVLALQDQVDEYSKSEAKIPLCSSCITAEKLKAKELDLAAVVEENRRLKNSNRQFRRFAEMRVVRK